MDELKFFAWLDGELPPEESERVAAAVAADPELQAKADAHRQLGNRLRDAFGPIAEYPVPAAIAATGQASDRNVVDLAAARERRLPRRIPVGAQWAAMAATLAIGIVTGTMIGGGTSGPIASEDGRLVASASLENALYARLASAPAEEGPRIGLTFRDRSGNVCRTFSDRASSGLACREGGDWRIRGLFQAGEANSGDYRMASAGDPRLGALIDETIAGEPFDAEAERRAMEQGWR